MASIEYEGAWFRVAPGNTLAWGLVKSKVKQRIGRYRQDDFLKIAYTEFAGKKAPVLIDVGCNIGTTALPIAVRFPQAQAIAIDAHPIAMARFIENVRLNRVKNISAVAAAISDQSGFLRIHTCLANSGGNRVTGFEGRSDVPLSFDNITVPAMTLKRIIDHFAVEVCDLLKIDVEGYELSVLKSAQEILTPKKFPIVVLEYGSEGARAAGVTGWQIVQYMLERGYRCHDLHSGAAIEAPGHVPELPDFAVTDFIFHVK